MLTDKRDRANPGPHGCRKRRATALLTFLLPALLAMSCTGHTDRLPDRDTAGFTPPPAIRAPAHDFSGRIGLRAIPELAHIEVIVDEFNAVGTPEWSVARLPALDFRIIHDGTDVIPVQRGAQPGRHAYWEWILEPGKAWADPERKGWTQLVLPFSLQERNQNCTHNGLLGLTFRPDRSIASSRYLVGSETCSYLKANMWGELSAEFQPGQVPSAAVLTEQFRRQVTSRLAVKPLSSLADEYPGTDWKAFLPPGLEDVTVYGLVIDGTHYRGGCDTRFGPHPFCDAVNLPSYSTAKSVFAGLAFMYLEKAFPGFADMKVADLVPECRLEDGRWNDVTMRHLLNMQTGNYDSADYDADEGATKVTGFFLPENHAGKINFACTTYSRKSPPGEQFVYHTFDTYILGTAMNAFLKNHWGDAADIFSDVLADRVLGALNLSAVAATTRRTRDEVSQPFTGYGLTWISDDIARIAQWLGGQAGKSKPDAGLSGTELEQALFRQLDNVQLWAAGRGEAYSNGFWGFNIAPWIDCDSDTWIPFMAGFGGIVVALLPNGSAYYYFSDGNQFKWADAAAQSNKIRNYCGAL